MKEGTGKMDIGKINLTQYPPTLNQLASGELSRGLTLQEEEDLLKLQLTAEKMYRALKVFLESKKLKSLLTINDHMAFKQAQEAVALYEDNEFHI
jgi:hypothetical protein